MKNTPSAIGRYRNLSGLCCSYKKQCFQGDGNTQPDFYRKKSEDSCCKTGARPDSAEAYREYKEYRRFPG